MLNIHINAISSSELLKRMDKGVLFTPNVDHLIKLQKDEEFYNAYKQADYIVCDSVIVQRLSKLLRKKINEVIPGSSFFPEFYKYHKHNKDIKIFLLGAAEGVALQAMENINKKVGREIVVAAHSPSFGFEKNEKECQEIISLIKKSSANVLVVGVGAPKQEKWILKYKKVLPEIKLFMALGATIDFEAGILNRAPEIIQKLGFEWLFRVYKEPKRLWKRYFVEDIPFFLHFSRQILGAYKDPFVQKYLKEKSFPAELDSNPTKVHTLEDKVKV